MGYTNRAIAGFSWQTFQKGLAASVTIAKMYCLARLLDPTDFGLFSLTAIAVGITESFTETGINLTILQAKQSVSYFVDTAWIISIGRGFFISLIMLLIGKSMTVFFQNPILWQLITVAALIPIIKGFINPAIVTWHKDMAFFSDSFYRLSLILIEAIASVLLALILKSVWALVGGLLIAAVAEVIISFWVLKLKPKFKYSAACARQIFTNAKWLTLATAFHYLNENVDNLLLGKLVGTFNLGIYQNAYALSHKLNYEVTKSIHHGTIPIFTRIVDSTTRLKQAFTKSLIATTIIVLAGSIPLLMAPELVVTWLLGPKWLAIIPLVRVLTLAGLIQSFSSIGYTLFLAKKSYLIMNLHLGLSFILMTSLIWIWGSSQGVTGAINAIFWSRLMTAPLILFGISSALRQTKTFSC